MAITLSVADNGNDTGATATLSGGGAGASNTVYTQSFDGELGAGTWTSSGTRTGNGTVSLTLEAGHYFAYVLSDASGVLTVSGVVYFVVTTGEDCPHYRCKVAAQARIRALLLPGLHSDNVLVRKVPYERNPPVPMKDSYVVVISQAGQESQRPGGGTNERDDVGYPVLVTYLAPDNQSLTANDQRHLNNRWLINKAFRNQPLSTVDGIWTCIVEPGPITTSAWWLQNVYHSSLLLRFISREGRGF